MKGSKGSLWCGQEFEGDWKLKVFFCPSETTGVVNLQRLVIKEKCFLRFLSWIKVTVCTVNLRTTSIFDESLISQSLINWFRTYFWKKHWLPPMNRLDDVALFLLAEAQFCLHDVGRLCLENDVPSMTAFRINHRWGDSRRAAIRNSCKKNVRFRPKTLNFHETSESFP